MDNDFNDVYEAIASTRRKKKKRKSVLDMNLMQIEFAEKSIPLKYVILARLFAFAIFFVLMVIAMYAVVLMWNM